MDDRDLEREVARALEKVAGSRYEEEPQPRRRWRNRLVKGSLAALAAVCAAATVFYTLESHRLPPPEDKPAGGAVPVTIVPPKPR